MNDELLITSSLDQSLPTDGENEILDKIETIIQRSIDEKNAYIALNACRELVQVAKVSGLALAKLLYMVQANWAVFGIEETFDDIAYEYVGLHPHTVGRYLSAYAMFAKNLIPNEFESHIRQMNIMTQIPIAKALEQGYEIEEADWQKIAEAPDFSTVAKIIREDVKGKEPHKGSLQIFVSNIGEIYAFFNGERYHIGVLEIDDDSDAVQKAINRIVDRAGIMRS